jgi:hypothetical protein
MSLEKPTILLLPGAWHRGSTFEPVAALLRRQGYPVETPTLLSAGGPTSTTVADDAAHIQKRYLTGLIAQGKEVVVVMHSYSGIPGTDAVKGHTRKDVAAQGRKGGVVALVYMAAFLIPAGQSVDSSLPGGAASIMTFDVRRSSTFVRNGSMVCEITDNWQFNRARRRASLIRFQNSIMILMKTRLESMLLAWFIMPSRAFSLHSLMRLIMMCRVRISSARRMHASLWLCSRLWLLCQVMGSCRRVLVLEAIRLCSVYRRLLLMWYKPLRATGNTAQQPSTGDSNRHASVLLLVPCKSVKV